MHECATRRAETDNSRGQRQPQRVSSVAIASRRGRTAAGFTPLDISAKTSRRPSASVTTPARLLTAVSVPVLARTTPRPAAVSESAREPVVERAVAPGHGQAGQDRAQLSTLPSRGAGRGREQRAEQPSRDAVRRREPAAVGHPRAGGVEAGLARAPPRSRRPHRRRSAHHRARSTTSRASVSASTLSDVRITCSTRSEIGADVTVPRTVAPAVAVPSATVAESRPSSPASARPAARAGSVSALPVLLSGIDATAVDHHRLDRGDEAPPDVDRLPARGERRPAVAGGVDQHLRHRHPGGRARRRRESSSRDGSG